MTRTDVIGEDEIAIEAMVNGRPLKRRVKARQHLADFLRQELELTGTHLGCEHGICGACTLLIDAGTPCGSASVRVAVTTTVPSAAGAWVCAASGSAAAAVR